MSFANAQKRAWNLTSAADITRHSEEIKAPHYTNESF